MLWALKTGSKPMPNPQSPPLHKRAKHTARKCSTGIAPRKLQLVVPVSAAAGVRKQPRMMSARHKLKVALKARKEGGVATAETAAAKV